MRKEIGKEQSSEDGAGKERKKKGRKKKGRTHGEGGDEVQNANENEVDDGSTGPVKERQGE
jgi:hypothetical protein